MPQQSGREADLWQALWLKPQAMVWERLGQELEVALYVRRFAEAEQQDASVALSTLVRQMGDSLGLTTPGLRANRWRIERAGAEPERTTGARPALDLPTSARSRLRAVPGGSG